MREIEKEEGENDERRGGRRRRRDERRHRGSIDKTRVMICYSNKGENGQEGLYC